MDRPSSVKLVSLQLGQSGKGVSGRYAAVAMIARPQRN